MAREWSDERLDAWRSRRTVAGLFPDRSAAERGIRQLQAAGFPRDAIGVATRDRDTQGALVAETGSQAAEGAAAGAISGGVLGGIVGLLIGVGALVIPGLGPVIAGGALASALGIAGSTAAVGAGIGAATGGVLGGLVGMGIPEEQARHFERGFAAGGVLVTIAAGDRWPEARAILQANGADLGPTRYSDEYATPMGARVSGAEAAVANDAAWRGSERRTPGQRGRRQTDLQPAAMG